MHFVGISTTNPTGTGGPTVTGVTSFSKGDVVLYEKKEFVYDGIKWVELGDEGSYVLKTTTINNKPLSANITLSASDVGADASGTAAGLVNALDLTKVGGTGKYIQSITQTNGQVSATAGTLPTALKNPHALTFGTKTYDGSSDQTITAADLGAVTDISGKQDKLTFDGTYNASTNKAATVSTVTNAINGLSAIAKSGSVSDLTQPNGVVIVFNCGSSSTVI